MNQILDRAIIISRTNYGEADRILSLITPDHGKLRLMARGVRKLKSKLAGGIEYFSTCEIAFINGRREIGTLTSARLIKHYGTIIKDIDRVQLGYELIKLLNKATEDQPDAEYYDLLEQSFMALDDAAIDIELIRVWFQVRLLKLAGYSPNLSTDTTGSNLKADQKYNFDFDSMTFTAKPGGQYAADHIKILRLLYSGHQPAKLHQVRGLTTTTKDLIALVRTMLTLHIRT